MGDKQGGSAAQAIEAAAKGTGSLKRMKAGCPAMPARCEGLSQTRHQTVTVVQRWGPGWEQLERGRISGVTPQDPAATVSEMPFHRRSSRGNTGRDAVETLALDRLRLGLNYMIFFKVSQAIW